MKSKGQASKTTANRRDVFFLEIINASSEDGNLFISNHEYGGYSVVNDNFRYIYYVEGTGKFYNTKEAYCEWQNLVGDEKYRPIVDDMKWAVPKELRK